MTLPEYATVWNPFANQAPLQHFNPVILEPDGQ